MHYKLPTGLLQIGDPANFILIEDLTQFKVKATYINGQLVAENGESKIPHIQADVINNFNATSIQLEELCVLQKDFPHKEDQIPVIEAIEGQLITNCKWMHPTIKEGQIKTNTTDDILKLVVYNRYHTAAPKIAFIHNFGFTQGAIASTVAHDSHNIIAVGVDDISIMNAINEVVRTKGGISCVNNQESKVLGLPVAGLMTPEDPYKVTEEYIAIDKMAKALGGKLNSPFMTLSFMALLVIPHLKLSDLGLFDGDQFKFM
jgi:adenine deaminase